MASRLVVIIDGVPLPEPEAREFWARFSAHMEQHRGDLAGFARSEGLARVQPELHAGEPVLIASRTGTQSTYAPAPKRPGDGQSPSKPKGRKRP
jgi:hypothetical protein